MYECSLLREYIELEFNACLADKQLSFALDVERVVDDIVLFCMLVGNDFLPGEQSSSGCVEHPSSHVVPVIYQQMSCSF